ncbi:MAG: CheR family methyltransferase [Bacteroidota bacterium]
MRAKTTPGKKIILKEETKNKPFPIVAIGASAGGLESVTQLLQNLPSKTGMSFIYMQHLSPDYKSVLVDLLSRVTQMKVIEATNSMLIDPNTVYVIPAGKEMIVSAGYIKLSPRKKDRSSFLSIDSFFSSLAEQHKEQVIGIVLSGSATDGTIGLKAIKHEGGLTFAQDNSAKFNSMPKSAIAAGVVDFVLSPKEIARKLVNLSKFGFVKHRIFGKGKEDEIDNENVDLKRIIRLLREGVGVDFTHYKMNTIKRRILRRLVLNKKKTLKAYATFLSKNSQELDTLYQDLLINVTNFFRDVEAHLYLKASVFPKLLKSKAADEMLRIWVAACSTGEEAYSMAMTILEIQGNKSNNKGVQIFATDLSEPAINKARIGEYTKQELEAVSPERLKRFYTKSDGGYRIAKSVRDMCIFAPHNILSDPPFSRVDFISCRNLLIYLESAAQKKVISMFHYALNDGGYLMLGESETIGTLGHLFANVNKKFKIYARKKSTGIRVLPDTILGFRRTISPKKIVSLHSEKHVSTNSIDLDKTIDSILLSTYVPPSVIINYDMDILQFRGATSLYLQHSAGKASLNILKLIRPEIAFELRTAIHNAIKTKKRVQKSGIEIKIDSSLKTIRLEVVPLSINWDEPLLLILFNDQEKIEVGESITKGSRNNSLQKDRKIKKLEDELMAMRNDLRSITEEQESANQELQSANEEIASSNEEFQSVNEELETSKEEIESTNEELITTNQELQMRNELLTESYNYSEAILVTIHEPMIILDKNVRVKSANKSFYDKFHLKEDTTEGVPLYELGNRQLNIPRLRKLIEDVYSKGKGFEDFEVKLKFPGAGEKIMLLNAKRIVQSSHNEHLILLAFHDITERTLYLIKEREKELLEKNIQTYKTNNAALEKAVKERTKQIEEVSLALENKNHELESINKKLTSFTYISSHDLQEPLRKIQLLASHILEKEAQNLSEKGKDYFNRMQLAAKRMQTLIEDLLAYSHADSKKIIFEKTNINEIVKEIKDEFKEEFQAKGVKIQADKLPVLNVIRFQFHQLMHNLISNALKFSDPNKPLQITINSEIATGNKFKDEHLSPKKKYCHISISDNGIGFDPQFNDRIFEVFQRLHGKDEYKGTGIGLAICKKIVENHHGFITANGELKKGATFNIYLPIDFEK